MSTLQKKTCIKLNVNLGGPKCPPENERNSQMKTDKFKIANLTKDLIINVDKYLVNFPRKEIELKIAIREATYRLLEIIYLANETYDTERRTALQEEAIAKMKYIDFLLNLCYDKQIIDKKKYLKFGITLEQILTYVYAWRKTTGTKNV